MKFRTFLGGFSIVAVGILLAQNTVYAQEHIGLKWQKNITGPLPEEVHSIIPTSDGGFALTGTTESYSNGKSDILFLKTDRNGNIQYMNHFGGADEDAGHAIIETSDGGFVIAGSIRSADAGLDAILLKVDATGVEQWSNTYGGDQDDQLLSMTKRGSGFVLAGWTLSYGSEGDGYIIVTDSQGSAIWTKIMGGPGWDAFNSIAPTRDDGFILTGETKTEDKELEVWVVKLHSSGGIEADKKYGGSLDECGYSVKQCDDGGYIVCGRTFSYGNGEDDGFLLRLNASGSERWSYPLGGKCSDVLYSVTIAQDGGFLITGNSASYGYMAKTNGYLIRTDSNGHILWENYLPGKFHQGSALQELSNGDIALALTAPVAGNTDITYGVIGYADVPPSTVRAAYGQTFTCIDAIEEIGWGGFKKNYWELNKELGCLQSHGPGGNGGLSRIYTPEFNASRDSGKVRVGVRFNFPTKSGINWHNNNNFRFSLCDASGEGKYTVEIMPNRVVDTATSFNLALMRDNIVLGRVKTGRVSPQGEGTEMSDLKLMVLKDNTIQLIYDARDGMGPITHISVIDATYRNFSKVFFRYKTGNVGGGNYHMLIDQVDVMEYKEQQE